MEIKTKNLEKNCVLIQFIGKIDHFSIDSFSELVEKEHSKFLKFIFDCSLLTYLESDGIIAFNLIKAYFEKTNREFVLIDVSTEVRQLFKFFGLDKKFIFGENLIQAISILDKIKLEISAKKKEQDSFLNKIEIIRSFKKRSKPIQFYSSNKIQKKNKFIFDTKVLSFRDKEPSFFELNPTQPEAYSKVEVISDSPKLEMEQKQEQMTQMTEIKKEEPKFNRMIQCEVCNSKLSIQKIGKHQCPTCNSYFIYNQNGSVSYLEAL